MCFNSEEPVAVYIAAGILGIVFVERIQFFLAGRDVRILLLLNPNNVRAGSAVSATRAIKGPHLRGR